MFVSPSPNWQAAAASVQESPAPQDRAQQPNPAQNPSPPPQTQASAQDTAALQPGEVTGAVTDVNNSAVSGATVLLEGPAPGDSQTVQTNDKGFFEIRSVKPGIPYHVTISADGFAGWTSPAFTIEPGQNKLLASDKLKIEELKTNLTVSAASELEIATEEVRVEEKQRGLIILPNFFETFDPNPHPLTPKLKFGLSFRAAIDPATFAGVALIAGAEQGANLPSYGQGAKGFGKRFAATYANNFTDIVIGGAILPSLLHQDPRYYYQGTLSKKSRVLHALSALVITKGDNGRWQPNYSSLGGDFASAAISNAYYPKSDRNVGMTFESFGINTLVHAGVRLMQEFLFHPATQPAT